MVRDVDAGEVNNYLTRFKLKILELRIYVNLRNCYLECFTEEIQLEETRLKTFSKNMEFSRPTIHKFTYWIVQSIGAHVNVRQSQSCLGTQRSV